MIGLGRWPSTRPHHYFQAPAQLVIEWTFDASRYGTDPIGDAPSPWAQNATIDRQIFASVFHQLVQTRRDGSAAAIVETLTSLGAAAPRPITAGERVGVQGYVFAAWRFVTWVLANGGNQPPRDAWPMMVRIARAIEGSAIADITGVTVWLRVRTADAVVPAMSAADDPVRRAVTVIQPALRPDAAGNPGLDWYATEFQSAFDLPDRQLLLASSRAREDTGGGGGAPALWTLPLGKLPGVPYGYQFAVTSPATTPAAMFFAPPPLSTSVITRPAVTLYSFDPDVGLSRTPDVTQSFAAVDLDAWAREVLPAFDTLLSPELAVPALLVDRKAPTANLDRILETKRRVAGAIAATVTNVLTSPPLDRTANAASFAAAAEAWRQEMLVLLGSAYTIDTAVQYAVDVTAPVTPNANVASRLYGSPAQPAERGATIRLMAPFDEAQGGPQVIEGPDTKNAGSAAPGNYAAGSFNLPLVSGPSLLTYAFTARFPGDRAHIDLALEYPPTALERRTAPLPAIGVPQASSWLTMLSTVAPAVVAGEPDFTPARTKRAPGTPDSTPARTERAPGTPDTAVAVSIPLLLRACPTPPALLGQTFVQSGTAAATTLSQAREWTFRFTYGHTRAAQDHVGAVIQLNVPPDDGDAMAGTGDAPDLFVMLARLNHVLPQLLDIFRTVLPTVDVETDAASRPVIRAHNAVAAFRKLTDRLDDAWTEWSPPPAASSTARGDPYATIRLPFSIREDSIELTAGGRTFDVLRVTVVYPATLPPGVKPPMMTFDGFAAQPASPDAAPEPACAVASWIYATIDSAPAGEPYLTWEAARKILDRRVDLAGLDAIRYRNARAGVSAVRNLHLVRGNPTRDPFVYRTGLQQAARTLSPHLDSMASIDIAAIPAGTAQNRTLADHLTTLFDAFLDASPSPQLLMQLAITYRYPLSSDLSSPAVELPVLLLPPADFASGGDVPIGTMVEGITSWIETTRPPAGQALFVLDLSAFCAWSNNPEPLVRLRSLSLHLAHIT